MRNHIPDIYFIFASQSVMQDVINKEKTGPCFVRVSNKRKCTIFTPISYEWIPLDATKNCTKLENFNFVIAVIFIL